MKTTANSTYGISDVSVLSFFGIIFALMPIPMKTPIPIPMKFFGYIPGTLFFLFFVLSIVGWFTCKTKPKHKIIFAIFIALSILKILGLIIGNDYHIG
jgi:hypothetical protein